MSLQRSQGTRFIREFAEIEAWFHSLIKKCGMDPVPGSAFARALDAMKYLSERATDGVPQRPPQAVPETLREGYGAAYLLRALRRSEPALRCELRKIAGLFGGKDLCLLRAGGSSTARNRAWELLVAALCGRFASDVKLVEPPDVACTFEDTRWGLACKVLYSSDPERLIDVVVEGTKQIERSDCDLGLVMVNASSLLPHEEYFGWLPNQQKFLTVLDMGAAAIDLNRHLKALATSLGRTDRLERLRSDRATKNQRNKVRHVLFFGQTVVSYRGTPALLTKIHLFDFRFVFGPEEEFTSRFNDAAQRNFYLESGLLPAGLEDCIRMKQ